MKINYEHPTIDVIEIEVENVLCQSDPVTSSTTTNSFDDGGNAW